MEEEGFRSHHSITESILGFIALLRSQEFNVGIREVQEALTASRTGLIQHKKSFCFTLKAILCSRAEDVARFDGPFHALKVFGSDVPSCVAPL